MDDTPTETRESTPPLSRTEPRDNPLKFASLYQLAKQLDDKDTFTTSEVIIEYMEHGRILIETITEGVLEEDSNKVSEACHTLRMTSYAIGAMRLSAACFEFSTALSQQNATLLPQAVGNLEALFIRVCHILQQELDQRANNPSL